MASSDHRNHDPALERRQAALDRRERRLEAREAELSARRSPLRFLWALRLLPAAAVELAMAALLIVSVCLFRGTGRDVACTTAAVVLALLAVARVSNIGAPL